MNPIKSKIVQKKIYKIALPPPIPVNQSIANPILHTYADKSTLIKINSKELSKIPIWCGQRTLDEGHKARIQKDVKDNIILLDGSLYHLVTYPSEEDGTFQQFIIDGQHRASILHEYYEQNPSGTTFSVLVKEKLCSSHAEAVQYFKVLNTTKAIEWREDPKLIASTYLNSLIKEFPPNLFRSVKTKRPRIHLDKLHAAMIHRRFGIGMSFTPDEFAVRIVEWNEKKIESILQQESRTPLETEALKLNFALGLDENFGWLDL